MLVHPETGDRHLVGIAVDITEQRRLQASRAEADARLKDALEATTEAFALWDRDRRLVIANSRYQSMHGIAREALVAGRTREAIHAEARQPLLESELPTARRAFGARSCELHFDDGRWFLVNEQPTKDGGIVSVSTDITGRKLHECEMAESRSKLEGSVRALEAAQKGLRDKVRENADLAELNHLQKIAAVDANLAKSRFLANMSHELRTPLNHIIGFAEVMESGMYGALGHASYTEYVAHIGHSGRHLLGLINDVLDMSALESGRYQTAREPVALAGVIDACLVEVAARASARGVELAGDFREALTVRGDEVALQRLFGNLVGNAVKFTPAGGRITVRARRIGGHVAVAVADTGKGIAAADIARVMRPFEQPGAKVENGCKGSGLGLAIARALAEVHGGTMRLRSTEGVGTVVMVRLPVAEAA
jgi:two-component system, cell cycle sensor histidine kinase PleC